MNTRTSKLIFPAILFLFACLIAFGENGPTPKIVVGSSGISDGSVTTVKLADDSVTAEKISEIDDVALNSLTLADKIQAAWADILGDVYASGSAIIAGRAVIGTTADAGASYTLQLNGSIGLGGQKGIFFRDDDGFSGSSARRAWAIVNNVNAFGQLDFMVGSSAGADPMAGTIAMSMSSDGILSLANTPVFADNAAAITGGLAAGNVYKTSTGQLMIVYTP